MTLATEINVLLEFSNDCISVYGSYFGSEMLCVLQYHFPAITQIRHSAADAHLTTRAKNECKAIGKTALWSIPVSVQFGYTSDALFFLSFFIYEAKSTNKMNE